MSPLRALALVLALAACGNQTIPLPEVHGDDPVLQMNPDRWQASVNDLMIPLGNGDPHPVPAPVRIGSTRVPAP